MLNKNQHTSKHKQAKKTNKNFQSKFVNIKVEVLNDRSLHTVHKSCMNRLYLFSAEGVRE